MSRYYMGRQARRYNARLRRFSEKTLSEALAMVDVAALHAVAERVGRPPRMLDVACGTGTFLKQLLARIPSLEAYGIDASADMLEQARAVLDGFPGVRLEQVELGAGETATLSFPTATFDLITCTNALHDLPDPVGTLVGLRRLLTLEGQLVLEDFARRAPPFPWKSFEWLVRRAVGRRVQVYSLAGARSLSLRAGLQIEEGKAFRIDWLLHGWALRASRSSPLPS